MNQPLDTEALTRLDDYLRRQLPEAEVDGYEEALFARALSGHAPELQFHRDLSRAFRELKATGTIEPWLSRAQAEAVLSSGVRVLQYDVTPGIASAPDLSADFDVLLTKIHVDLHGLEQVDVEVYTPDGHRLKVMPEITFDPQEGAVYTCCEADLARAAASVRTVSKLVGTNRAGERTIIATLATWNEESTTP